MTINKDSKMQNVFIIGSKSIGQYGGYETFVDKLIEQHQNNNDVKYHIACKANGDGYMDETKLSEVEVIKSDKNGKVTEFNYHNAHVFKIPCPNIGPMVAIYYDTAALLYAIRYCKLNDTSTPIFYVLTCRIGLFIKALEKRIKALGGQFYLNPDGHEWKRTKWNKAVRIYWKWSERRMVNCADLIVCDSKNIERYIINEYKHPKTTYIAYGADLQSSCMGDDDLVYQKWLSDQGLLDKEYYLIVGRFVPENNYETMIREFMESESKRTLVIISNMNNKLSEQLEKELHYKSDPRIHFAGTVYDKELLKKIRENAYGYLHGHEVGGTNPSLLEALSSTNLNLLLDVGFNKEVGENAALYWNKEKGNLADLINRVDAMDPQIIKTLGNLAKDRIKMSYSWEYIASEYMNIWINSRG